MRCSVTGGRWTQYTNIPGSKSLPSRGGHDLADEIISVKDLKKVYGSDILAVDGITFSVMKGEIFGFLGPNGAGKSTTIKILTTLISKTSGTATIDGLDIDADQVAVRRIIGYASQEVGVDDDLTARENLMLQCRFHHMS